MPWESELEATAGLLEALELPYQVHGGVEQGLGTGGKKTV